MRHRRHRDHAPELASAIGNPPGGRLVRHQTEKFLRRPPTIRNAAAVIVSFSTAIVILSALAIRITDPHDFPSLGLALWWAVQTVTTVGYGDVTPKETAGRVIATIVMLEGIAFLAILTAAITSTFVARAQFELDSAGWTQEAEAADDRTTLADISTRLRAIEALLQGGTTGPPEPAATPDHPDRTTPPDRPDSR